MSTKILIIQEPLENYPDTLADYKVILDFLGYENHTCRDADKLPEIMKTFDPDIAFWIYPWSDNISEILQQHRQANKDLKIIWADDHYGRIVGDTSIYYDRLLVPVIMPLDEFQNLIAELLGGS